MMGHFFGSPLISGVAGFEPPPVWWRNACIAQKSTFSFQVSNLGWVRGSQTCLLQTSPASPPKPKYQHPLWMQKGSEWVPKHPCQSSIITNLSHCQDTSLGSRRARVLPFFRRLLLGLRPGKSGRLLKRCPK